VWYLDAHSFRIKIFVVPALAEGEANVVEALQSFDADLVCLLCAIALPAGCFRDVVAAVKPAQERHHRVLVDGRAGVGEVVVPKGYRTHQCGSNQPIADLVPWAGEIGSGRRETLLAGPLD
jgi:hypothetical protein